MFGATHRAATQPERIHHRSLPAACGSARAVSTAGISDAALTDDMSYLTRRRPRSITADACCVPTGLELAGFLVLIAYRDVIRI